MAKWLIVALALVLAALAAAQLMTGPSEASETMDGISVKGPQEFRDRTRVALDSLNVEWHTFVTRWLNTVQYDDSITRRRGLSYVNVFSATFHVGKDAAFGYDDDGYDGDSVVWYACGLVHEAQHVYQYKYSHLKYGREAEFDAMGSQLACLRKLGAPRFIIDYVEGLRECIYGDGCKYWKQHRGW